MYKILPLNFAFEVYWTASSFLELINQYLFYNFTANDLILSTTFAT